MKKINRLLLLFALTGGLCLSGCRERPSAGQTEEPKETEAQTQASTQPETKAGTEKQTEKTTESTKTTTTKKTTVKSSTKTTTKTTTPSAAGSTATAQCPYCYQQISTAPNPDGTTVYSVHVAQEKAWADMYGYGDTPPVSQQTEASGQQQTDASQQEQDNAGDDSMQCGYCYQWFTVSDGSYAAHLAAENEALGLPQGTEYITCPKCGNAYPKGIVYDTHVCNPG